MRTTLKSIGTRCRTRRRGFMFVDAVMGLMIVGVVAVALAIAVGRQQRAAAALAQQRGAIWAAEHALAQLQAGRAVEKGVEVEALQDEPAPAGHAWVRVRASHGEGSALLIGLVPQAKGEQP